MVTQGSGRKQKGDEPGTLVLGLMDSSCPPFPSPIPPDLWQGLTQAGSGQPVLLKQIITSTRCQACCGEEGQV